MCPSAWHIGEAFRGQAISASVSRTMDVGLAGCTLLVTNALPKTQERNALSRRKTPRESMCQHLKIPENSSVRRTHPGA